MTRHGGGALADVTQGGALAVAVFGERLRERADPAAVETDIAATVRGALRPGGVAAWVRREAA